MAEHQHPVEDGWGEDASTSEGLCGQQTIGAEVSITDFSSKKVTRKSKSGFTRADRLDLPVIFFF